MSLSVSILSLLTRHYITHVYHSTQKGKNFSISLTIHSSFHTHISLSDNHSTHTNLSPLSSPLTTVIANPPSPFNDHNLYPHTTVNPPSTPHHKPLAFLFIFQIPSRFKPLAVHLLPLILTKTLL